MAAPSPIVRTGLLIWGFMFCLSAPVSGFFLFRMFLEAQASARWPTVPGLITRAEVRDVSVSLSPRYTTLVAYTYAVGGRNYAGSRIRAGDGEVDSQDQARMALGTFAPGQTVPVYYDPADPGKALLHAGAGYQEYAMQVVPVLMLAAGVALLYFGFKKTRPPALPPLARVR